MSRNLAVALSQPQQLALEKFRAVLYGDHPYGRLFPTEAMIKGYTLDQVARLLPSRPTAPARSRLYVVGRFDPPAVEAAIRKAFDGWDEGHASQRSRRRSRRRRARCYLIDRPGAPQSTVHPRAADSRSVARRLHPADGDGRAARRRLRLAHHQEHPRGQGLHLLAVQRALDPLPRRLLGRERRRHDRGDRPVDQGDLRRDRPAAGRAADDARS